MSDSDAAGTASPAPTSDAESTADGVVDRRAVAVGSLAGVAVLATASIVDAILKRNIDDYDGSGWRYPLFVLVLAGYALAGWLAGREAPSGALTNGAFAGIGAFVLWVPVRVLIWVARDESRSLFTGDAPVFKLGQIFGHLVIASALGMLGGFAGARMAASRATADGGR